MDYNEPQNKIRKRLLRAEKEIKTYSDLWDKYHMDHHLRNFHYFCGRRRFLIKELVKAQLKAFNPD